MNTEGKVWGQFSNSKLPTTTSTIIDFDLEINKKTTKALDIFRRNPLTVLAVSYSSFSDPAIESFLSTINNNNKDYIPQLVIKPILNPIKWILWSKLIPKSDNSFAIWGDLPGANEIFGMENKFAGYVFLIDSLGKIKWKAAGVATVDELKSFYDTINDITIN